MGMVPTLLIFDMYIKKKKKIKKIKAGTEERVSWYQESRKHFLLGMGMCRLMVGAMFMTFVFKNLKLFVLLVVIGFKVRTKNLDLGMCTDIGGDSFVCLSFSFSLRL